jgi:hypothetical protein
VEVESIALDTLVLDPDNANKGKVAEIVQSLQKFGQHRPAVVQRSSMKVLIGNHMVMAARKLGWDTIDVTFVEDDDTTAVERALSDNQIGRNAVWDDDRLLAGLKKCSDIPPGFAPTAIVALENKLSKEVSDEPSFPIVPRFGEKHDYVLIISDNETDWAFLTTVLQLRRERGFQANKMVGTGRVLTVARFTDMWNSRSEMAEQEIGEISF